MWMRMWYQANWTDLWSFDIFIKEQKVFYFYFILFDGKSITVAKSITVIILSCFLTQTICLHCSKVCME